MVSYTGFFYTPVRYYYWEGSMTEPPIPFALNEFEDELPVRDLLMTLTEPRARYAVYYLSDETSDSVTHLADVVTGWVNASTGMVATRADRDRTRMLLYHVDLPTLDSLDVLQFDPANRTVTMEKISPTMESFIDQIRRLYRTDGDEDLF